MKTINTILKLTFFAGLLLVVTSCSDDDEMELTTPPMEQNNIVETAQATSSLSSLVSALAKADESANNDLITALSSSGPFTVLAPSNDAFNSLLARLDGFDTLDDFNNEQLQDLLATILTYHVVPGAAVASGDLTESQSLTTLEGGVLTVSLEGGASFTDEAGETAFVTTADVETENGIVHIIDKVLIPQSGLDALSDVLLSSITDLAISVPQLSSLVAALQAANDDLPVTLATEGPFTVFAPTNDAFAAFLEANNFDTLQDVPVDILTQVLLNHVVSGTNMSSDLSTTYVSTLSTAGANDANLSMFVNTMGGEMENSVVLNGVSTVTMPDNKAINGVVHIVDAVIGLPNVVDHAIANPNLTSLVGALTADGNTTFTTLLGDSESIFTVFAPLNTAFEGFASDNDLNTILANHVISGAAADAASLTNTYFNTLATNADEDFLSLYVNVDEGVKLNGTSTVAAADIVATNGIIHAVDAVIDLPNVVTFATADPNFSSLVGALTAEGQPDFVSVLSTPTGTSPAPFTVFAPVNDAFAALSEVPSGDALTAVLNHHVIAGLNIVSGDLSDGLVSPATLEGDTLTFSIDDDNVTITDGAGNMGITIIAADVQANNGVIHAINTVMIPNTDN